jgi:hypothetical protein
MPHPHDCSHAELDPDQCPYCADAHAELLERLKDDGAVGIATLASWAMFERREESERAWRAE